VSFLRDTRSSPTWSEKEFASALNVTSEEVKQTLPGLQLAGYIEPLAHGKWRTTEQGELVGGGKTPRFTRESVEQALSGLKERIQTINADQNASYRITRAVAFGDFLGDRVRVQAATVGIELNGRSAAAGDDRQTAASRGEEDAFLKQLNGNRPFSGCSDTNPG
jgi:predicted transcriptional regulator